MSSISGAGKGTSRIEQIDGLRAVAILTVLAHHFGFHLPGWLDWGPLGVRLFFLLSGYFITLSLWRLSAEVAGPGRLGVALVVFHARRLLRVVPVLYLALAVGALLGIPEIREAVGWHLAFLTNFFVAKTGYWPPAVSHLWSISVQEQFYLVWPFVVFLTPRRWFLAMLAVCAVGALGFRLVALQTDLPAVVRWVMLPGVLDSFAAGAFLAWAWACRRAWFRPSWGLFLGGGVLAGFCFALGRILRYRGEGLEIVWIEWLEAVFLGWLLVCTLVGWPGWVGRFMGSRPLCYLGRISFGIYAYHVLVHIFFAPAVLELVPAVGKAGELARFLILCLLTIGFAALSWHFLEQPLARFRPKPAGFPVAAPAAAAPRRRDPKVQSG